MPDDRLDILKWLAEIEAHPLQITEEQIAADPTCVDYDVYLKSKIWAKIRRRVLRRDEHVCKRCRGRAKAVHHRSYDAEVLKGDKDDQLVSICAGCHAYIELDDGGNKRSEDESDRLLGEHDPAAFPKPMLTRVGPRKQMVLCPPEWNRMSDVQRGRWFKEALRLGKPVQLCPPAMSKSK